MQKINWNEKPKKKNEQLRWSNLKLNKCPSCNGDFANADFDKVKRLFTCSCGFKIGHLKMIQITSEYVKKGL